MSYCRFENTARDLQDCVNAINRGEIDELNDYEVEGLRDILELCKEILDDQDNIYSVNKFEYSIIEKIVKLQNLKILDNRKNKFDTDSQDTTKWHMVDNIANVFNRLIIFNANQFHTSMEYFGQNLQDGRLFQTFFFDTQED